MADKQQVAPAEEHHYDPLLDGGKKKRKNPGKTIAIVLSILVHAALFYYIYITKFVIKFKDFSDEAVKVDLVKPGDKPPPPPPPPPKPHLPPPPQVGLAPHIPPVAPIGIPEPPPIEIPVPPPAPPPPPPPPPPAPTVITNPDWQSRPDGDDMARYYPERAQRLEKPGNVTIQCEVTSKGQVANCTVVSEDPADFGFGDAALKLSKLFKMKPQTKDGKAIEGATVKIPIAFRIAE